MALFTQQLLRERRADRRWRVFFRLAWLILFIIVAWSLFVGRGHGGAPSGPHTALIEVRGEIAADSEASAENLVAGLKGAFEGRRSRCNTTRYCRQAAVGVDCRVVPDRRESLDEIAK
jgi:protease-4